jgi:hypothetical protein
LLPVVSNCACVAPYYKDEVGLARGFNTSPTSLKISGQQNGPPFQIDIHPPSQAASSIQSNITDY